jgi:hypothetical protein
MVMLPRLLDRLARLAQENDGAIGVTHVNNLYYVSMGSGKGLWLDVVGNDYILQNQLIIEETLTCSQETSPTPTRSLRKR